MKTPDEVKKGLECCTPVWTGDHWKSCNSNCPYIGLADSCRGRLMYDALAYIQQLESKLAEYEKPLEPLTWEEAIADDYYLEQRDDEYVDMALNILAMSTDGPEPVLTDCIHFATHSDEDVKLMRYDYGKTWRCWSRKPTDEERKAAKWDGLQDTEIDRSIER